MKEYEVGDPGQRTLIDPDAIDPEMSDEEGPEAEQMEEGDEDDDEDIERNTVQTSQVQVKQEKEESTQVQKSNDKNDMEEREDEDNSFKDHFRSSTPLQDTSPSQERPKQASKFDKLPIKILRKKDPFVIGRSSKLGRRQAFDSGLIHWSVGGGDTTEHIQTHFESRMELLKHRKPVPVNVKPRKKVSQVAETVTEDAEKPQTNERASTSTISAIPRPTIVRRSNHYNSKHVDEYNGHHR